MSGMDGNALLILALIALTLMSGFFSASETAYTSLNRVRLKSLAHDGDRRAEKALALAEDYDKLLSGILVGNNIVNILSASLATVLFVNMIGGAGVSVSTAVMTVIVLLFGEITPKSIAKEHPEKIALAFYPLLNAVLKLLTPIIYLFSQWQKLIYRIVKPSGEKGITEEELITIAWGLDGKVNYALEGSVYVAGAAIQWLRDELKLIDGSPDSEYFATRVKDTAGCYVVPAFTGLGAPHWDPYARGAIVGLTRGVNKYHLIRATLESLAFQTNDVLHAMELDSGMKLGSLKVNGGASMNNFLMQFQADLMNAPVHRPVCVETTAMGASYLAGLSVGFWEDKEDVRRHWSMEREFTPAKDDAWREEEIKGWNKAVNATKGWAR